MFVLSEKMVIIENVLILNPLKLFSLEKEEKE